jgi:hypothetical protein
MMFFVETEENMEDHNTMNIVWSNGWSIMTNNKGIDYVMFGL